MAVEVHQYIIVILLMTAFILGITTFTGDLINNYPNVQNATFLNQAGETSNKIAEMQETIQENQDDSNVITAMLSGAWRTLNLLFDVIGIFTSLIGDISNMAYEMFGLPVAFGLIFNAIITVLIIFAIAYLVMNMPR